MLTVTADVADHEPLFEVTECSLRSLAFLLRPSMLSGEERAELDRLLRSGSPHGQSTYG